MFISMAILILYAKSTCGIAAKSKEPLSFAMRLRIALGSSFTYILKPTLQYSTEISRQAIYYWTLNLLQRLRILDFQDLPQFQILKEVHQLMYLQL